MIAEYPLRKDPYVDDRLEAKFGKLMDLIGKIRQIRTEINIEPARRIHILLKDFPDRQLVEMHQEEILWLTRGEGVEFVSDFPPQLHLARGVLKDYEIGINLEGVLNLQVERDRLEKELRRIETELLQAERKLSNENFRQNAPEAVVEEQKARHEELTARKKRTEEHLRALQ